MKHLTNYELVNRCETAEELSDAIIKISNPQSGLIEGRSRSFNAYNMANACFGVIEGHIPANMLTREYGIRQQALYIKYYTEL